MAIKRVLVANRGEIALRVIRAAKALNIETVLIASSVDMDSEPARLADRVLNLGPGPATQSYLRVELVMHAAIAAGCDAIHPGYGFLSEKSELPRLCDEHGLHFVGPRADTIDALGDKLQARALAKQNGVPLVPGTDQVADVKTALAAAEQVGYPVVMKASAGGGGKGMFVARSAVDIESMFDSATAEARQAFGDGTLYIERYVENARHVEVQILGNGEGEVVHCLDRDCSIQRRYQKLIEEAPAILVPQHVRDAMQAAAVSLASGMHYKNAGTVEFIYDIDARDFYFIEVNARIQVEHPVTEVVTGIDLVQEQFRIAAGEGLSFNQADIAASGHAIECRINAEDPARDFVPSPGRIERWAPPAGEFIRLDSHCYDGYLIPPYYDSMIGKLIVNGEDRAHAVSNLAAALAGFELTGLNNNIALHRFIADSNAFSDNTFTTKWLENVGLDAFKQATA
ncbi:MAG: acetyl-CoA carboxylase biotin carboxylase subunit [Pseudomonadota bacterium]